MEAGEILRRVAFQTLDKMNGSRLDTLKKVNKREIVQGVTDDYAERRLEKILEYARKNTEFYRKMDIGDNIKTFPVMKKTDYNLHKNEILSDSFQGSEKKLFRLSTSGSTGVPFTVYCDRDKMNRVNMNFISVMELNGFRLGMKRGEFRVWIKGKNTISKWKSFKNNLLMIDISNMGEESLEKICSQIRKKRIQVLVSYSSALTALAEYIKRKHIDTSKWKVEMIFSMGEALPDATFEALKNIFRFAPVRSYGNNENGFIAVQLNEENRYTADLYNFYIEILKLDSDEEANPGEVGRIVVTDFYNKAFPMIRYDTGDTGIYEEIYDQNGRKHGYFKEIYGRKGSVLYNCKGDPLSIHVFMNVLLNLEDCVYQAKCIQWEKKKYELLVNGDRKKIQEEQLIDSYKKYLGDEAEVKVTYVEEIPVQASGKRMVCENRCPEYQ